MDTGILQSGVHFLVKRCYMHDNGWKVVLQIDFIGFSPIKGVDLPDQNVISDIFIVNNPQNSSELPQNRSKCNVTLLHWKKIQKVQYLKTAEAHICSEF